MRRLVLLVAIALMFSSGAPVSADAPAPTSNYIAADMPSRLGSVATFTSPKDWSSQISPDLLLLIAPEHDLRIALVNIRSAISASDAAAKAWNVYKPGAAHAVRLVSPLPAKDGWDERADVEYETSANEKLSVGAYALRHANAWTVMIYDGYQGTAEKRGAALGLVYDSLRPVGFTRESFAGRRARALDRTRVALLLRFLTEGMSEFDVPGVGFGLQQNGKTLYAGGLGYRDLAARASVDAHTRFMIASNTKGLTTLMLARLVDRGLLQWNERRTRLANTGLNDEIVPFRPAGAAWSSVHDMLLYAEDELREGVLPNGARYVSAENLLQRRAKSVATGERSWYGMGLAVNDTYDVSVVHHGGDLTGYHSDWYAIPNAGITAVILTNADDGYNLRGPLMRRMLELLYDGKPLAAAEMAASAQSYKAEIAKERPRLAVPAPADHVAVLAGRYANPDLGTIDVVRRSDDTVFNFGAWESAIAARRNDDGTTSFVTIDPGVSGFEFVPTRRDGKRALIIRDGQHEYVYTETT